MSKKFSQENLPEKSSIQKVIPLTGGLDQITPNNLIKGGKLRKCQNFEADLNHGYTSITGYESFDGRPRPSSALYYRHDVTITGSAQVGDSILGVDSSATAEIVAIVTSVTPNYFVTTKVVGDFNKVEVLNISGLPEATSLEVPIPGGAPSSLLSAQYANLAADVYRADIQAPPGSGPILGIAMLGDSKFAFKNNVAQTAANIWKNSAAGWVQVPLGFELPFTSGGADYATGSVELIGGAAGSVDGITIDSVEIMSGAETFDTSLAVTAQNVVDNINANTSVPNYTATLVSQTITISAVTSGITPNGFVVAAALTTITTTNTNMAGGVDSDAIEVGDIITGATSAETATLTGVMLESGSWVAGTAAGKLIFLTASGAFQAENLNIGAALDVCTIASDADAIVLLPDGRYEIIVNNFGGGAGTDKMYGCDLVNRGFEFDGTTFLPINTGMTVDVPTHVEEFKNHLFFAFAGSAQHSGIGSPYSFTVISGAGELAVGDNITAFQDQPGAEGEGALAIISRNRVHVLYGTSSVDWNLVQFRTESGAFPYTVEEFGMTMMLDDRGIKNMRTTQAFGNFVAATLSQLIQPWINERKQKATASCISRDKSQYRLFFSDNYALYITTDNNKIVGMMPVLLDHSVTCTASREVEDGTEEMYFGATDGKVYQQDRGTSFDGGAISASMELHYLGLGSPRMKKRFLTAAVEISGGGYHDFAFRYKLGYGTDLISQPQAQTVIANFDAVIWDTPSMIWDNFRWDGETLKPSRVRLSGRSENISLIFTSNKDYYSAIRFSSVQLRIRNGKQIK